MSVYSPLLYGLLPVWLFLASACFFVALALRFFQRNQSPLLAKPHGIHMLCDFRQNFLHFTAHFTTHPAPLAELKYPP